MVTIIGYRERQNQDGEPFFVLELQGGIEMVQSKTTGDFYATAKRAFVPSTFDGTTCESLLGTTMQGSIIKEECEPYDYVIKETGEEIILYHRWVYLPDSSQAPKNPVQAETETFSTNGVLEHA